MRRKRDVVGREYENERSSGERAGYVLRRTAKIPSSTRRKMASSSRESPHVTRTMVSFESDAETRHDPDDSCRPSAMVDPIAERERKT